MRTCVRTYLPGRPRPRHARRRPGRTASPAAAAAAAPPRLRRRGLGDPWRASVTRSRRAGTASGAPRIGEGAEGSRGEGSGILGVGRSLIGGRGQAGGRRRRRGRMGDRERRRGGRGVGWDATRGEVMWGRGRPRSPSCLCVFLCASVSLYPLCCASCVCASSHIFLSREVTWWGFFYMWTLAKQQNIFLTQGM